MGKMIHFDISCTVDYKACGFLLHRRGQGTVRRRDIKQTIVPPKEILVYVRKRKKSLASQLLEKNMEQ